MSSSQQVALHGKDNRLGGIDPIPPGRWQQPGTASPFLNGWVNAGGGLQTFRWRRTNENQTEIQGVVTGGTAQPVINLPDPYRPAETQYAVNADSEGTLLIWTFEPSGDLSFVEAAGGGATGAAGGVLDGTYPNPGIAASVAGSGLSESSNVLAVNVDNSTVEISSDNLRVKASGITENEIGLADVTSDDVTSTKHGFAPKAPADATKFLDGSATPAWDTVKDSDLSTSDITTNDVTTSKHGFTPKAPNDSAKFLRGDATWATIGGTGTALVGSDPIWDAKGDLAAASAADTAVRLAVGSNGKILTANSGETSGLKWDTGYLGGLELVYRYTVTGSDKASIDTGADTADAGTNDWADGDVLEIIIVARTDEATTRSSVLVTLNNDTGANYDEEQQRALGTGVAAAGTVALSNWPMEVPGASAAASYPAVCRGLMPAYADTTFFKMCEWTTGYNHSTAGSNFTSQYGFSWRSTSAVTRLKVGCTSTNKLKVGSKLLIYKRRSV